MPHESDLTESWAQRDGLFRSQRNIILPSKKFERETDGLKKSLFLVGIIDRILLISDKLNQLRLLQNCEAAR